MRKIITFIALFFLPIYLNADEPTEEIDMARLSETLGHFIVRQLNQAGFPLNIDLVIQGIRNESEKKPAPMSESEYEQAICALQEQQFLHTAELNLAQADAFLKENASKKGVRSLEEKLQFFISKEGKGEVVDTESVPLIHYKGSLINGTVFASSEGSGEPVALPIKQSIPGFAKGLVGMKEGEKRTLYIHPELAYGVSGQLPPNSLLIFEVEIVKANTISLEDISQAEKDAKDKGNA